MNVEIPQSLQLDHFSLIKNETISLDGLATKFGEKGQADKVFYYDRYVSNYYQ